MVFKEITARAPNSKRWGLSHCYERAAYWKGTDGFTLLDNVIALAMIMFTMLALVGLLGAVISANATSKKRTVAMGLVEMKLAEIRRQGFRLLTADETVTENYAPGALNIPAYPNYKRVTSTKINTPTLGMQMVTITVYWDRDKHQVSKMIHIAP
jgi:type II secretory pathway pseudopilin PulG